MISTCRSIILNSRIWLLWLCALFPAGMARSADPMVSYSLDVSENLAVLMNQNNPLVKANAANVTPFQLAVARNTPYLLLENTSTTANGGTGNAALTHFELSISASNQTFDWVKVVLANTDPGVTVQLNTPNGLEDSTKNQTISMDITGLTPGKKLIFQVDLDPLDPNGYSFADYRDVFFKLDQNSNDVSGNATTKATFFDSTFQTSVTVPAQGEHFWQNQPYPEQFGEPILGLKFPSKPHGDHVQWFPTGDSGAQPVPEPSALVLASLSLVGVLIFQRLSRRNRWAVQDRGGGRR